MNDAKVKHPFEQEHKQCDPWSVVAPYGRPKGSYGGRIQALAELDKLLAKKKNLRALIDALEAASDRGGGSGRHFA
ncbi:MAG: hypothetical protein ACOYOU_12490 [Kiritimatiellia bacterium]